MVEKDDSVVSSLVTKMEGLGKAEQARLLKTFLDEAGKTAAPEVRAPVITISDEQIAQLIKGGADEAKSFTKNASGAIERKYNVSPGEAKDIAERTVQSELSRKARFHEDCKVAAKVFRGIALAGSSRAKHGELQDAYDQEKEYMSATGREVRNLDVGTGSEGGYLAPELWNTMLYENLARVSLLRKFGYWFTMDNQIMRLPKLTANVTGNTVAELSAASSSQPTFAQATWNLKKLTVLTNPFSIELFEHARPELVQMLLNVATIEMNRKEDEVCFNTTDSGWSGQILGSSTNVVTMGAGKTDYSNATFDDMASLIFQLAEQYVPDEDVGGSGIVGGGEAQFWVNKKLIQSLLQIKGTTAQYIWGNVQDLELRRKLFGHPVRRVLSMPSTTAVSTKFAAFGNLSYQWVGYRPGFFIDLLKEGQINGTNLAATSSYALRINELLDIQTIDANAFSLLKTAAA